eukprot:3974590-Prymnesium_polylepis.1
MCVPRLLARGRACKVHVADRLSRRSHRGVGGVGEQPRARAAAAAPQRALVTARDLGAGAGLVGLHVRRARPRHHPCDDVDEARSVRQRLPRGRDRRPSSAKRWLAADRGAAAARELLPQRRVRGQRPECTAAGAHAHHGAEAELCQDVRQHVWGQLAEQSTRGRAAWKRQQQAAEAEQLAINQHPVPVRRVQPAPHRRAGRHDDRAKRLGANNLLRKRRMRAHVDVRAVDDPPFASKLHFHVVKMIVHTF